MNKKQAKNSMQKHKQKRRQKIIFLTREEKELKKVTKREECEVRF
jgi:hypothetical protein